MKDLLLEIRFDSDDALTEELIASALYLHGCAGSTVSEEGSMTAWFDDEETREAALAALTDIAGVSAVKTERERIDWLDRYQQSLEAMPIGQRFLVAPDASLLADAGDRLTLVVPQEQAFGTGSHETTSLCIELLEETECHGRRGLDIGSGSGILALAMVRLGARRAIAFDNDPDAYAALHENRARNGVTPEQMPVFIGGFEALRGGSFEVATMNILPEVIIPALPQVVSCLARGATLILSGVLIVRAGDVIDAARGSGLRLLRQREKGEWWAAAFSAYNG